MRIAKPDAEASIRVLASSRQLTYDVNTLMQDDIVLTCYNILSKVVAANDLILYPEPDTRTQALFERAILRDDFKHALQHLVLGEFVGFSVVEVVWSKQYFPSQYRALAPHAVSVHLDENGDVDRFDVRTDLGIQQLPLERAIYLIADTSLGSGNIGLLQKISKLIESRQAVRTAIQQYFERHAVPPIMGVYPTSYSDDEIDSFFLALQRLRDSKVFAVPMTVGDTPQVQFLQPSSANIETALEMYRELTRDIGRVLLGPVLALFEAQFGTRAQAQVHQEMLMKSVAGLQLNLENSINKFWGYLCQLHLGTEPISFVRLTEPNLVVNEMLIQHLPDLFALGVVNTNDIASLRSMLNLSAS